MTTNAGGSGVSDKDYRVDFRVRNARVVRRMEARGWNNADLARQSGVSQQMVGKLINLKIPPVRTDGNLQSSVLKICAALDATVEELWPVQHLEAPLRKNRSSVDLDLEDLEALSGMQVDYLEDHVERRDLVRIALENLTPRERSVLSARYGLDGDGEATLEEIAADQRVTRERIRQIEKKAIRKSARMLKNLLKAAS